MLLEELSVEEDEAVELDELIGPGDAELLLDDEELLDEPAASCKSRFATSPVALPALLSL